MHVFIWAFHKNASLPWTLGTAEQALAQHGFAVLDPARNANVHVLGRRNNPDTTVTVVCTRLNRNPTSVVVQAFSPDVTAARVAAEQVRDHIKRAVSLENDVVQNPVNE
jgi:hypothetical protein